MKTYLFRFLAKRKFCDQRGITLLLLVFIITALVGVGTAIYTFSTSSTFTELTENNRNRAYQLAWAGLNYAAEQYAAGTDLSSNQFKNKTYTLTNNRGQITYNVNIVGGYYHVVSIGTVNANDGLLLARAQVGSRANQFPVGPTSNNEIMKTTFRQLSAFNPRSLTDAANHTMIRTGEYVATGGTHLYWAAFTDLGTYPRPDDDNPGCNIGFHVGFLAENYVQQLRQVWNTYNYVDYDAQAKMGWYKGLAAAVSGLNFRWHEVPTGSGKYEGYGLSFLRYTYSSAGCGAGYDYIPNSIKPPGQAGKLLLVLWEQRVSAGTERRRWLAYAVLGTPATFPTPPAGADLKVIGAQDNVDGLLNDNAGLVVRIREQFINGRRVNDLLALYSDASPYFGRSPNTVCPDLNRKRMTPEWIDDTLFPRWPSNNFDPFTCGSDAILNFWRPDACRTSDPNYYDYFTLMSTASQTGFGDLPGTICGANTVQWVINPAYAFSLVNPLNDPNIDSGGNLLNTDRVSVFPDKGTLRTYKFILDDFTAQSPEIGLHGMGRLNNSDRVVAFDDWALQVLGRSECP
ncbi:MAG: hypothetical protein HY892_21495 [Deltaproteobacteria bacterium]|nr:hypothetical protein [Deltaproteobacteria bacterium]